MIKTTSGTNLNAVIDVTISPLYENNMDNYQSSNL